MTSHCMSVDRTTAVYFVFVFAVSSRAHTQPSVHTNKHGYRVPLFCFSFHLHLTKQGGRPNTYECTTQQGGWLSTFAGALRSKSDKNLSTMNTPPLSFVLVLHTLLNPTCLSPRRDVHFSTSASLRRRSRAIAQVTNHV